MQEPQEGAPRAEEERTKRRRKDRPNRRVRKQGIQQRAQELI